VRGTEACGRGEPSRPWPSPPLGRAVDVPVGVNGTETPGGV